MGAHTLIFVSLGWMGSHQDNNCNREFLKGRTVTEPVVSSLTGNFRNVNQAY